MAKAKSKSNRRRRAHPLTKAELKANNPDLADVVVDRFAKWKNLGLTIAGISAGLAVLYNGYFWIGGRAVITDYTLSKAVEEQNHLFDTKITAVKTDVNKNITDTKDQITGTLGQLTDTLKTIAKKQDIASIDQTEMQMRVAFTQKQNLQNQLVQINQGLVLKPDDQMLATRKLQIEDLIKMNDQQIKDAQDKMTKLRTGQ